MGTHKCHVDATCANTIGSFACSCNIGYVGDGYNCTGIMLLGNHDILSVNNGFHLNVMLQFFMSMILGNSQFFVYLI